jgi:type I restriction enzyme S subunit
VSWPLVKLEAVSEFIRNGASIKQSSDAAGLPITRIETIADRSVNLDKCGYADVSEGEYLNYRLRSGDMLISHINSEKHLAKCAIFESDRRDVVHGMNLLCLRPRCEVVFPKYLFQYLSSPVFLRLIPAITKKSVNQASFTVTAFKDLEIPLPPLPEQKRIAAILDKADAIRRKRQQAIQLADDFLRAVFLDMFGELVTSSGYANSQKYKLLELVDYIDYRGKTPEKSGSGIPLITAKNVKSGYVDDEPREYIPEENYGAWMTRGFPRKNDVLFTTEAPLGNVALLGEYERVAIGQRLVALRSKGKVTHEYLLFLLLHPFIQDLIYARSSGSTVKGIRTKELYAIELPVPDMQKQREFSAVYWKSKSLTSNQEYAHQLDVLNFSALSQKAFAGQL